MKCWRFVGIGFVICIPFAACTEAATRYAKVAATGLNNCTSWANACTLADALVAASAGDQVWVKAGTYPPLVLKEGVKLYGGFFGLETAASQSNPRTNVTIIDGGGVDRCLYGLNLTTATLMRGFTIRNGYHEDYAGGALLEYSSPVFVNCTFEDNFGGYVAGAVWARWAGRPEFHNCIFRRNGAITSFEGPYAGGAIVSDDESAILAVNCLFHDNLAGDGGAVFITSRTLESKFINCTFANNQAHLRHGGAIWDEAGNGVVKNCILWGNTAAVGPSLSHQIFNGSPYYNGTTEVANSDVQGGWAGTGNINANPLFGVPTPGADYRIPAASPCKDTGANAFLPLDSWDLDWDGLKKEVLPIDLQGLARIKAAAVDIGAYEVLDPGEGEGDE